MTQANRIDGHTLSWVKSEIDSTMDNARKALEAYVEAPDDESQLRFCLNYLHQVYGTLQMVELYGAGMLAQELEVMSQALLDNQVKNREDAYEVMMRGMMQLPDYLEQLQAGQPDYPMVLLPLLNDLRAARSAALLSESALFSPDLDVQAPAFGRGTDDSIDMLIRKMRYTFHLGLLDLFRESDVKGGVKRISAVIEKLRSSANDPDTSRVLWAASGVAEALYEKGIDTSVAVKSLMGQVDRQFKKILDDGEFALSTEPPTELLKNLLYYVASSQSAGSRVQELKDAFQLNELMPDTETLERARADLSAPNAALMKTVSSVLLEDLTQVKDNLDVFVRSEDRDPASLSELCGKLVQMGDTLDMLGFGDQRMILQDQIAIMEQMSKGEREVEDNVLMDVAGALLSIEGALNEPTSAPAEEAVEEEVDDDSSIIRQFADPDQRRLVKRVVDEVKVDLGKIKESFNDYSRMPKNVDVLNEVPSLLDRIRGSLSMLTLNRAADVLTSASKYVQIDILNSSNRPEPRTLDLLADAISGVEYYLESLTESWGHPSAILDVAEKSLSDLGIIINAPEESTSVSGSSESDEEQTLVDITAPEFDEAEEETLSELGQPDDSMTMELASDDTEPEIDISAMEQPDESELSGEFSLEGYDEAGAAMSPESTSDDVQEFYNAEAPETEGSISQEFNLPVVEEADTKATSEEPHLEELQPEGEETPRPKAEVAPTPAPTSIADELDDEIIEIFLEEAEEEHANISRLLPTWQNNPADEETLKDLRRSFHTLKGSGRLVGASDVGEFAWAFENMLNRVIDNTIEHSADMFNLLDKARDTLPGLLNLFRQGDKPGQDVFTLMDLADAVSKGKVVDMPNDVTEAFHGSEQGHDQASESEVAGDTEQEISLDESMLEESLGEAEEIELELDDADSLADLSSNDIVVDQEPISPALEIDLDAVEVPEEQSESEMASPLEIEGIELDLDDGELSLGEGLEEAPAPEDDISGLSLVPPSPGTSTSELDIDPVLLGIYQKEIATHLTALREYIDEWHRGEERKASPKLIRALHTLKGSSRTASVPQVAELCGFLEEHAKYLEDNELEVENELVNLLEEAGGFVADTVDKLNQSDEELPDNKDLIIRTRELLDKARYETPTMQIQLPETMEDLSAPLITDDEDTAEIEDGSQVELIESPLVDAGEDESELMKAALEEAMADEPDYDEELLEIFLEEGVEILDESDNTLQDWISSPESPELVKALQRQLHTLKGGARMAGVIEVGDLSHSIETMLTAIVDNHLDVTDDMFKALQKAQDALVGMLETVRQHKTPDSSAALIDVINGLAKSESVDISVLDAVTAEPADTGETAVEPEPDLDFSAEISGIKPTEPASPVEEAPVDEAPATEPDLDSEPDSNVVPLGATPPVEEPLEPSSIETATEQQKQAQQRAKGDLIRVRADLLDNLVNFAGEVSIYRSRMEQQSNAFKYNLTELDDTVERFREQLRKFEIEAEAQIQYRTEDSVSTHEEFDPLEFDRFTQMQTLSRGMLESLNDLSSLRGILSNLTRESETLLLQQSRVNTDLQEGLMRTRMVPISGQIPRMRRIVRQTSEELGKKVELNISGADNELDRTVLERIMSPLEHMLRNAIAHGIETPEQRSTAGKDETGQINLRFAREGSDVVITVSDDGSGIDLDAIREKAVERGLIKADANLRQEDLMDLILESGFSTADEVTQISGRGVGMDVVNNEIKQLGGLLETKTEKGVGTTFNISMPLSLSVTRALMIIVGEEQYAIPLLGVETVERVTRDDIARMQSEENGSYHWLENDYQYIHLGSAMGLTEMQMPPEEVEKLPILLVRSGDFRAAIHVDGLIGSREIVVKPVGPQLSTLRGISGATVMGDGNVVLILDLGVLIRLSRTMHEEAAATGAVDEIAPVIEEKHIPLIMVVDDSITVRKVTTRLLERNDFKTVSAKDGVDALAQLQEYKPDVMLLDVEMPRMDGFELATNIRNDDVLNKLPIIMITSRTGQKHRDRAVKIGVNIYMGKPYSENELLENIDNLLNQSD